MKCSNCGNTIKSNSKFCPECGARVIEQKPDGQKSGEKTKSKSMQEKIAESEIKSYERGLDHDIIEDSFSDGVEDLDTSKAGRNASSRDERDSSLKIKSDKHGGAYNADNRAGAAAKGRNEKNRDYGSSYYEPSKKSDNRGGSVLNKVLLGILLLLLASMAVGVYFMLKGGIGPKTPPKPVAEVKNNPNDPDRYYITVRANEGTTLVFEGTDGSKSELPVSAKRDVTFNVHINSLLPQTYLEETKFSAKPNIYQIDSTGVKTDIEVPEIELDVPQLMIDFETPDNIESSDGIVTIKGHVATSQLATELTVNGEIIPIEEDGAFKYSVKRDKGDYKFDFLARLAAHTIVSKTFNATVTQVLTPEQVIVIPEDFRSRALNAEDSIKVYGAVPAGTQIVISSNDEDFSLKSEPVVDADGNFSFEVNLPIVEKAYPFIITATLKDGAVYERPFSVERPPVYREYVQSSWQGDYDEMMKPDHITDKRPFKITGTIGETIYDGDYLIAKLILENGKVIEIEYHNHYGTATLLEQGAQHIMYGFSLGTGVSPDGNLRMFIWFVQD